MMIVSTTAEQNPDNQLRVGRRLAIIAVELLETLVVKSLGRVGIFFYENGLGPRGMGTSGAQTA